MCGGFTMEMNELSALISTVGFPIVAFGAIFYLYDKTVKELTVTITKIDATLTHILQRIESNETHNEQS